MTGGGEYTGGEVSASDLEILKCRKNSWREKWI